MRNPLKRLARHDHPKVPLRARLDAVKERLAAAKDKAGRIVAVNRIILTKVRAPAPPVDRVALINYATWLYYERRQVCLELYPESGADAHRMVHADVEADKYHFPRNGRWQDVPQPSTRAVKILDMVGVDWRRDRTDSGWADAPILNAPAAKLPHGWPQADAALLEALDDLTRLDAAQNALLGGGDGHRDTHGLPGWDGLNEARNNALVRLCETRAESLTGLQVKAKALRLDSVDAAYEDESQIAQSLARDLLGLRAHQVQPKPDPIFAVIEEARRLNAEHTAACHPDKPSDQPDPPDVIDRREDACGAVWAHVDDVLLTTVPTTAEGCRALARFVAEFKADQGVPLDGASDSNDPVFALIARSPLL